jgi:hypothetical protein
LVHVTDICKDIFHCNFFSTLAWWSDYDMAPPLDILIDFTKSSELVR